MKVAIDWRTTWSNFFGFHRGSPGGIPLQLGIDIATSSVLANPKWEFPRLIDIDLDLNIIRYSHR